MRILDGSRAAIDAAARALAAAIGGRPACERLFVSSGGALRRTRAGSALFRRTVSHLGPRLARANALRSVTVLAHPLVVDVSTEGGRRLYLEPRLYEEPVTRLVLGLGPGDTFVDVGANWGYFTLLAATRVRPSGRVLAIEPNPAVHAELVTNLDRNGLRGVVETVQAAMTERDGRAPLFISDRETGLSSLVPDRAPAPAELFSGSIAVATATLDAVVESLSVRPTLVKIDVEGGEDLVLRGFGRTLASAPPPRIICETAAHSPADALLRAAGYRSRPLDGFAIGNVLYEIDESRRAPR